MRYLPPSPLPSRVHSFLSSCSRSRIAQEYDALIYLDETRALQPLDTTPEWLEGQMLYGSKQPGASRVSASSTSKLAYTEGVHT